MFNRSLTLQPLEYTQHINRLYNTVEHLLGWLKRINRAKQDPPGQWIPDLFEDLDRLTKTMDSTYDAIQQPYIRLLIQDVHLKLKAGFALESRRQTADLAVVPSHNLVIGFYFPPEDYPMVDGEYPEITISINAMTIERIQLDGTHQLYKPLFNRFWLHKNLLPLNGLYVHSHGKPYYTLQVFDSVNLHQADHCLTIHGLDNQKVLHRQGSMGFDWDLFNGRIPSVEKEAYDLHTGLEYTKHCNDPDVFSYPYIRAANLIKRCWVKHKLQQKRNLIGAEIRILPDIGVDVITMAKRHKQFGIADHPDRQLIDPPRVRGNYNHQHNLEERVTYAEEALSMLARLQYIEEAYLEMQDCKLSLTWLRMQLYCK